MQKARMTYYTVCDINDYYTEKNREKVIQLNDNKLLIVSKDAVRNLNRKKKKFFQENINNLDQIDETVNNENGRREKIANRLKKKLEKKRNVN